MEGILAKGEKCQEFLDRSCLVVGQGNAMHKNIFETEVCGTLCKLSANPNQTFTAENLCEWDAAQRLPSATDQLP